MFYLLAIPVLHSSGAWIAYGAGGYLAGTLASTWIGAFVLGNSALLASLGLISGAGLAGAMGILSGAASATALGVGSALTTIGLGGLASSLGIAPVATFLGLTPIGWAIVGGTTVTVATLGLFFKSSVMKRLNRERQNGGLAPITISEILGQVRLLEADSLMIIVRNLAVERPEVEYDDDKMEVVISGRRFSLSKLKYKVQKDGSEALVWVSRLGKKVVIYLVRPPKAV